MNRLKQAVDLVAEQNKSFKMNMDKIGKFEKGNKSIVWVGIERNLQLEKINKDLEQILSQWGYEKEKRTFKPHITIGRQVVIKEKENISQIPVSKTTVVYKISLMESTRVEGILTYLPLHSQTF